MAEQGPTKRKKGYLILAASASSRLAALDLLLKMNNTADQLSCW